MQLNFSVFIDLVENGSKPHTIRRCVKRRPVVGRPLHLYTGLRTKQSRRLAVVNCIAVQPIRLVFGQGVWLEDIQLPRKLWERLAWADGFRRSDEPNRSNMPAFWEFFCPNAHEGETYEGFLISWRPHMFLNLAQRVARKDHVLGNMNAFAALIEANPDWGSSVAI